MGLKYPKLQWLQLQPACVGEGGLTWPNGGVGELWGTSLEAAGGSAVHDGGCSGLATPAKLCKTLEATAAEAESRGCSWDLGGARSTVEELRTSRARLAQKRLAGEEDLAAATTRRNRDPNEDLWGWEAREGEN